MTTHTAPTGLINTKRVTDRRKIRFESGADLLRDLDAIDAAHAAGTLRTVGNWAPAQVLNHLAAFIEFASDGYPAHFKPPPTPVRLVMRIFKKKYCFGAMPVGLHIPGVKAGTIGQDNGPFDHALARLRLANEKLENEAPSHPNHLFGVMSHEEWKGLNLRHCELHLSFLHPR